MPPLLAAIPAAAAAATAAASGISASTAIAGASLAAGAIGTGISAEGTLAQGRNAEALGNYQQAQGIEEADTSVARAQRKMEDEQRRTKLVQSQLTARAAGAGLNPSVGSTDVLAGQIGGRGTYESLTDLAQGQDLAAGYTNVAAGNKYEGDLSESLAPGAAAGTLASGAGSMFSNVMRNPGAFGIGGGGGAAAVTGYPLQLPGANYG